MRLFFCRMLYPILKLGSIVGVSALMENLLVLNIIV